jgi:hypothetical protein
VSEAVCAASVRAPSDGCTLRAPVQGDLFAASKIAPEAIERVVAGMIASHRGRGNPISINMLASATGRCAREIKGTVEQLIVAHRLKIGALRDGRGGGYFMIADAEDLAAAVRPYRGQIFAMWRRLSVLLEKHELRELHGQLTIEEQ